ncbi:hypothetical protein [Streptomyces tagetis]|uniref:hypothetical protein n=1 Tax=Streptomyces tagetis TaxID=2820809 RepID=UPI00355786A8
MPSDRLPGVVHHLDDGGVASGPQSTMLRIGGALGTCVLVTVIVGKAGSTLYDELTGTGVLCLIGAVADFAGIKGRAEETGHASA